jgi:fructose 1,6-bisphosphatase
LWFKRRNFFGFVNVGAFFLFLAQPIGLIRLSCPSVLTHDNSRTERVRGFKFCTNTSYVNSDYVSENGPNRVIRRTAGLLIPAISARFESVAYKYVASFMRISNSKALLTIPLQIVEFKMKYYNATKSQVHSASQEGCHDLLPDTSINYIRSYMTWHRIYVNIDCYI